MNIKMSFAMFYDICLDRINSILDLEIITDNKGCISLMEEKQLIKAMNELYKFMKKYYEGNKKKYK